MTRTTEDSRKHKDTVIEVIKVGDDSFDLVLNHEVYRANALQSALPEWLCVQYGFSGDEYESILREIERDGRKVIAL